ncbi:MAG: VWA domain-containing protein [Nitrospinaceae bacterium]
MTYFRFQDPWLFLVLAVLPWMWVTARRSRLARFHFSSLSRLRQIHSPGTAWLTYLPLILRTLVVILLVTALARPQEGRKSTEILSAGVDIILAIDTSGSMRANDFDQNGLPIDRLTAVKGVVAKFIDSREFDRMGMVVFGGEAFTQCPLTLDHGILHGFLNKLTIGVAGDATAIGSAIGIAVKRLKELESKSKVIILLTDGRNNAGLISPEQAAEVALAHGIKIYTVGMGTEGQTQFYVDTPLGPQTVLRNVDLDVDTLEKIAAITGGRFFRAKDADSLKNIYKTIDSLEKSEVRWIDHSEFKELFPFFLLAAMVLLGVESLLNHVWLVRIP